VLDVLIWDKDSRQRQNVRLRDESALPLRAGDLVRIEAVLTRPAHAYLFLIETTGTVTPLFPWLGGDWSKPPVEDLPRDLLSLPEQRTAAGELGGFEVAGARGMETLVLALRDSPLPPSFDLPGLLAGLPPQREQDLHALVWFDNGLVKRDDLSRGFASFNPQRIDDPVLQTQDVLRRRLRRDFVFFTAVSYALQGDEAKGTLDEARRVPVRQRACAGQQRCPVGPRPGCAAKGRGPRTCARHRGAADPGRPDRRGDRPAEQGPRRPAQGRAGLHHRPGAGRAQA
jgi:hypothetical protein